MKSGMFGILLLLITVSGCIVAADWGDPARDLVYFERTTASGIVDLFQKEKNFNSMVTGSAGTRIVIEAANQP